MTDAEFDELLAADTPVVPQPDERGWVVYGCGVELAIGQVVSHNNVRLDYKGHSAPMTFRVMAVATKEDMVRQTAATQGKAGEYHWPCNYWIHTD